MKRKEIFEKVDKLLVNYCEGCFLYKYHRQIKSRTYAHRFCISTCTVGTKIKKYGNKLSK